MKINVRYLPPFWALLNMVAMAGLDWAVPGTRLLDNPWIWIGAVSAAFGVGMEIWAAFRFITVKTTINPMTPSMTTSLVIEGPYEECGWGFDSPITVL